MTEETPIQELDNVPYFFLVNDKYVIGTPRGMKTSDRTLDMPFQQLAENYDLQERLKLASAVFIKPDVMYADPLVGRGLHHAVAVFISAFAKDPAEQEQRRDYLMNNGLVRILVTDDELLKKIKKAVESEPVTE